MSEARILYTARADATLESEAAALAAVYRFLLDRYAKKEAAHPGSPDDAAKGCRISENEKGGRHVEH